LPETLPTATLKPHVLVLVCFPRPHATTKLGEGGGAPWHDGLKNTFVLPMVRDTVQTAWIYLGILALDAFVYMAAMNPGGGPNNSTLVMAQQLFTTAFTKGQFGVACAMGVVLAAVTLAFAGLVFLVNRLLGGKADS